MKREEIINYEGKDVFLKLKNGYFYTCKIIKINSESIEILDKLNLNSIIDIDSIDIISDIKKEVGD